MVKVKIKFEKIALFPILKTEKSDKNTIVAWGSAKFYR